MDGTETQTGAPAPQAPPQTPTQEEVRRAEREARKNVGVFDTEAAKAAKKLAQQRVDEIARPVKDYAKANMTPVGKGITDRMKAAGWKKFAVSVLLACFVVLIISLMI